MTSGTGRFVGRIRQLQQLDEALALARSGEVSLVVVMGEAGIGKTRFCREVPARARRAGFVIGWGTCWPDGGAPALWPWQDIFSISRSAMIWCARCSRGSCPSRNRPMSTLGPPTRSPGRACAVPTGWSGSPTTRVACRDRSRDDARRAVAASRSAARALMGGLAYEQASALLADAVAAQKRGRSR